MEAHAVELLHLAVWGLGGLGALFLSLLVWSVRLFLNRMDSQDEELKNIRELITSELKLLREDHHNLEIRVVKVEANCGIFHGSHKATYSISDP